MESRDIARIVHEANRAYCQTLGDGSQCCWDDAPEWQRTSAVLGIEAVRDGTAGTAEEQHESWLDEKRRTGWTYGSVKDPDAKTHPCMVPYAELPVEQQFKDHLFRAIVLTCLGHGPDTTV
jgi:hypothetical protein